MDDQELLADIKNRQATAGKSDPASVTRDRTNRRFEELKASILASPESPQTLPPSPTEIEAQRKGKIVAALEVLKRHLGSKYQDAALANWNADTDRQRTVRQAAADYCKAITEHVAAGEGVVLYGPVGTGKDHLAVGIAKAACLAGLSVKWLKGQEWFGTLRDAIDGERTEREIFRGLECDLLVISDPLPPMGALTQYQASMLYRLTEERSSRGGAIVATINVADDAEADARLGAQTWDRLKDRCWLIKCEWRSFRKPSRIV
jgi:DNA replication protein DnaC